MSVTFDAYPQLNEAEKEMRTSRRMHDKHQSSVLNAATDISSRYPISFLEPLWNADMVPDRIVVLIKRSIPSKTVFTGC